MNTKIANRIFIEDPTKEIAAWAKENLCFPNPAFEKKQRMGFWTGRTPRELRLYEWNGNTLILPFGVCRRLMPMLKGTPVQCDFRQDSIISYGGESVPLYDYQREAVRRMIEAKYGILKSTTGSGKGLPLNAKIYTPDGYVRNGDLQIGDEVLNSYGGVSRVTGIYDRGKQACYKITFTDDTSVVCDKDHLWNVIDHQTTSKKWQTLNTETLFKLGVQRSGGCGCRWEIPIAEPVQFAPRKVKIDPWLLGVLLGDGTFTKQEVSVSNTEEDILERVQKAANCKVYHRKGRVSMILCDKGSLHYRLADYGLHGCHSWEKFIPKDYIYNSVDVRLKVLQGLIDTDGSIDGTTVSVTSTSKKLMEDCLEIVQSLGGTGHISPRTTKYTYNGEKMEGRESYRLHLKLYKFDPFTSEKHKKNAVQRTKYVDAYRRIKEIKITTPRETRCITVDSDDSLYLTDGFVVTHNTQMGIALIKAHRRRALWLCHTADLLNQSRNRALKYMDSGMIGTITEGKINVGVGVTFATVQTMANLELQQYRDYWDVVIVDECHRVASSADSFTRYEKVLNHLSARHKFGLTATPERSDGLIKATFSLLGDVAYEVPEAAVADKVMGVKVTALPTGIQIDDRCLNPDGTVNYTKLIEYLTTHNGRNYCIASEIMANEGHSCLILSDRLEQLKEIIHHLPDRMVEDCAYVDGKMQSKKAKALREQAIEDMRTGKKKYLFASYSLAKEGLDIPRLDRLFLASPCKYSAIITQSVGRVRRTFDGKKTPVVYDFVDSIGFCQGAYKKRRKCYREMGAEIDEEGLR